MPEKVRVTQSALKWKTSLSEVGVNQIVIRGYPVGDLLGKVSFSEALHLLWTGELPTKEMGRLMDAVMIGAMDHGATPPSVLAARTVASTGAPLNAAMAAGVLALSRFHGAAIENAMTMLETVVARVRGGESLEEGCRSYLAELKAKRQRAPGIGHRLHTDDPRISHLFRLCRECGVKGEYMATMTELSRQVTEGAGRPMTVNIDGGIAAVFCEIGFPKGLANALFILCRLTGITAQANEERTREKPMRKISPVDFEYDGPARRSLTER